MNRDAYDIFTTLGGGDFTFAKEQRGNKVYQVPAGVKATSLHAMMQMMDISDTREQLVRVKLIEYGYITKDE